MDDDIIDLYTTGDKAKTIKVSARDMDDVEISSVLKNNAARVEVMKGKKDGEEPTPKEIADAAKGITITAAQITDAKKNGIPQTYVGADAIAYSSRTPYKIKSSYFFYLVLNKKCLHESQILRKHINHKIKPRFSKTDIQQQQGGKTFFFIHFISN